VLYQMERLTEAKYQYSVTMGAPCVPFVESESWPNAKILGIAKVHVQEMNK